MDNGLQVVIEMNEWIWTRFKDDLKDVIPEEIDWRPLPQANSINAIVRHVHLEAQWHLASLTVGDPTPLPLNAASQRASDSAPPDFARNLKELDEFYTRYIAALRGMDLPALHQQTSHAYRNSSAEASRPAHLLGFHQAIHLATHLGQIRTIRNLYRRTRGEPARFFHENPTFPSI